MLVSEDYPWAKLFREYVMYCSVGCINVAIFAALYWIFSNYLTLTSSPETFGWAVSFAISCLQAYVLHRWLTFESDSITSEVLIMDDSLCDFMGGIYIHILHICRNN